jgi:hypothetical protein
MMTRSMLRLLLCLVVVALAALSPARADHFRYVPVDEGAGHTHYRIAGRGDATVLVVRARAEYATVALRARDIAERLNRAVENQHEHGDLYFEVEWPHGHPVIHQVSKDGTIHFMIAAVTPGDIEGARRRESIGEAVDLARAWLDRVEDAVGSAEQPGEEEVAEDNRAFPALQAGPRLKEEEVSGGQPQAGINLRLDPEDAALYLDGVLKQPVASVPIPVSPGQHTIEAVRPGYRPLRQQVMVRPGQIVNLDVRLEAEEGG